jgi:hypothetical protein
MTPRERLMAALEGRPTDKTPVWLLFPFHPVSYYVDVRTHPGYKTVFDASRERGVILLNRRHLNAPLHEAGVVSTREEIPGRGPGQRLEYKGRSIVSAAGKKLLDDDDDLAFYCGLPVEADPARIIPLLDRQLPACLRERAEFPADEGAMMLDLGSPVNPLYFQSNLESYAIWSLTCPDLVEDLLQRFMARLRIIYRYALEHDLADVYFLVGSELASPPLLGLETFRRWLVPFEKELIALIHSYGKKVIQHYHGQIREVLPDFVEMAPDGLHTIESPPVGNCTLSQAYDIVGDRITLIGNIQYDEFRSSSTQDMARAVRAVLEEVNGRRFILSPTAGPFDPDPPPRLFENYLAFMKNS